MTCAHLNSDFSIWHKLPEKMVVCVKTYLSNNCHPQKKAIKKKILLIVLIVVSMLCL